MTDESDIDPALFDALQRRTSHMRDELDSALNRIEELQERIAELEAVTDSDPAAKTYESMTRSDKVQKIRLALTREAARRRGKASMDYKQIMCLFDGHPSPGHTYDLMELAANLDGFVRDTDRDGQKRIRVDLGVVDDDVVMHVAAKARNDETPEWAR